MSRFHAQLQQQGRMFAVDAEDEQAFEQQYARASADVFDRDREALELLDGGRPALNPAAQPPLQTAASAGSAGVPATAPPRPSLQRQGSRAASAFSEDTSAAEDTVQLVQVADDEPLHRFVTRQRSFSKEDFEALLTHAGMFNVGGTAADQRMQRSHLPPSKLDGPVGSRAARRQRPKRYSVFRLPMFRPDCKPYLLWSVLVLFSDLTYSAFIVPISIGMWTSFYTANWTTVSDFLFGAIFFVDMLVTFHVGFIATYNMRKVLVLNGRLVALQYIRSFGFVVDLFAMLAWLLQIGLVIAYHQIPSFNPATALIVMEVVRLMRFLRVGRLLLALLSNGVFATLMVESPYLRFLRNQNAMQLLYMLYLIAVVVNFLGCLWNFTAGAEGWETTWVNFYDPFVREYGDGARDYLTKEEVEDINRWWLYITGNYWALSTIATVGFGDIVPQTVVETLVVLMVECIGVLFFGLLISSVSELLQQATRNARRVHMFRSKMQAVETWMQKNALPTRLQRRIKTFYAEVWLRQHETKEETVLFQELPHALRNEVAWQACKQVFRRVPLLAELDDKTLYLLASKMTPFRFAPGHDLVTEGDPADRFWVLVEGEVVALYQYREAERIEGPAVVGESVLLQEHEEALRTFPCTFRTLTGCICWMVRIRDFKPMLATQPRLRDLVKARALQSLADNISRHPAVWKEKGLQRLSGALRRGHMPRSASGTAAPAAPDDPLGEGAGAAAARSRLARASAPVPQHSRAASWGGRDNAGAFPVSSRAPTSPLSRSPAAGSASLEHLTWREAAAAAVAAADSQQQQAQQQGAPDLPDVQQQQQSPPEQQFGRSRLGGSKGTHSGLAPLIEHQPLAVGAQESVTDEWPGAAPPGSSFADATNGGAAAGGTGSAAAADPAAADPAAVAADSPGRQSGSPLRSVLVMAERGVHAVGHGAGAVASTLASAQAALPTMLGHLTGAAVQASRDAAQQRVLDEAYDREMAEMASQTLEPSAAADADADADAPMQRLTTHEALVFLAQATQARVREDAQRRSAATAAFAAASSSSAGGGAATAAEPGLAGASQAQAQVEMLAELLAEMQALRRDVDELTRSATSQGGGGGDGGLG